MVRIWIGIDVFSWRTSERQVELVVASRPVACRAARRFVQAEIRLRKTPLPPLRRPRYLPHPRCRLTRQRRVAMRVRNWAAGYVRGVGAVIGVAVAQPPKSGGPNEAGVAATGRRRKRPSPPIPRRDAGRRPCRLRQDPRLHRHVHPPGTHQRHALAPSRSAR